MVSKRQLQPDCNYQAVQIDIHHVEPPCGASMWSLDCTNHSLTVVKFIRNWSTLLIRTATTKLLAMTSLGHHCNQLSSECNPFNGLFGRLLVASMMSYSGSLSALLFRCMFCTVILSTYCFVCFTTCSGSQLFETGSSSQTV